VLWGLRAEGRTRWESVVGRGPCPAPARGPSELAVFVLIFTRDDPKDARAQKRRRSRLQPTPQTDWLSVKRR